MPRALARLKFLRQAGRTARLAAIAAALPLADAAEADTLAEDLIAAASAERGEDALALAVGLSPIFSREARQALIIVAAGRWQPLIARLCARGEDTALAAAASLAPDAADPALIEALPDLLAHPSALVGDAAEQAIARLGRSGGVQMPPSAAAAVSRAISAYPEHRRRAVLGAALDVLSGPAAVRTPTSELLPCLQPDAEAAHLMLRGELRRDTTPQGAARALLLLTVDALRGACLERLAALKTAAEFEAVLGRAHLLAHPIRAAALRSLPRGPRSRLPLPSAEVVAALTPAAHAGLPRWLEALPLSPADRHAALASLQPPVTEAGNAPAPPVTPGAAVVRFGRAVAAQDHAAAASILFHARAAPDQLGALEPALLEQVDRPGAPAQLVATIAAALGSLRSPASAAAIDGLTMHADRRVRANAIEALVRRARRAAVVDPAGLPDRFAAWLHDADHRARANAVRAVILRHVRAGSETPAAALVGMLRDHRPQHRIAGLWVVDRVGYQSRLGAAWEEITSHIARIVTADPDAAVRARAAHTGRLLLARVRDDWSQRAPDLAERPRLQVSAA